MKERMNKHFALQLHIQRSRPIIETHILHTVEQPKKTNVREKSREWHNHKPQPFLDTKRKRKKDKIKQAQIEQTYEKHQD